MRIIKLNTRVKSKTAPSPEKYDLFSPVEVREFNKLARRLHRGPCEVNPKRESDCWDDLRAQEKLTDLLDPKRTPPRWERARQQYCAMAHKVAWVRPGLITPVAIDQRYLSADYLGRKHLPVRLGMPYDPGVWTYDSTRENPWIAINIDGTEDEGVALSFLGIPYLAYQTTESAIEFCEDALTQEYNLARRSDLLTIREFLVGKLEHRYEFFIDIPAGFVRPKNENEEVLMKYSGDIRIRSHYCREFEEKFPPRTSFALFLREGDVL